jgi:hypothetical protein
VRLLLASDRALPNGLGNENDLVGRYYMTHLTGECGALLVDTGLESELGLFKSWDGVFCQRVLRLSDHARAQAGILNIVFRPTVGDVSDPRHGSASLSAYYLSRSLMSAEQQRRIAPSRIGQEKQRGATLAHVSNVLHGLPEAIAFSARWACGKRLARRRTPILFLKSAGARYPVQFTSEQAPNAASRLVLTAERDPLGMRRLVAQWRTSEQDRHTIAEGYRRMGRALAGQDRLALLVDEDELGDVARQGAPSGGHHIGAARMGTSPRESVVDPALQLWGTSGLYLAGAAAFPTSGAANPTLTVVALGLRLGEHLASRIVR